MSFRLTQTYDSRMGIGLTESVVWRYEIPVNPCPLGFMIQRVDASQGSQALRAMGAKWSCLLDPPKGPVGAAAFSHFASIKRFRSAARYCSGGVKVRHMGFMWRYKNFL